MRVLPGQLATPPVGLSQGHAYRCAVCSGPDAHPCAGGEQLLVVDRGCVADRERRAQARRLGTTSKRPDDHRDAVAPRLSPFRHAEASRPLAELGYGMRSRGPASLLTVERVDVHPLPPSQRSSPYSAPTSSATAPARMETRSGRRGDRCSHKTSIKVVLQTVMTPRIVPAAAEASARPRASPRSVGARSRYGRHTSRRLDEDVGPNA